MQKTALKNMREVTRFIAEKFWRWDATLAGSTAIFLAGGLAALYGDDYALAAWAFFVCITWITARCVTDAEVKNHSHRRIITTVILFLGIALFTGSMLLIKHVAGKKDNGPDALLSNGQDLTLLDFDDLDRGFLLNNTEEQIYVSSIFTSVKRLNGTPQTNTETVNQMVYPKGQPAPFLFASAHPGVWHTLTYLTNDWNRVWDDVSKDYKFCSRAVVVSPDSSALRQFKEHYEAMHAPFPIGDATIEIEYLKAGQMHRQTINAKAILMVRQDCDPNKQSFPY